MSKSIPATNVDGQEPEATTNKPDTSQQDQQGTSQEQDSKPQMSREDLEAALAKARKESAAHRIERNKARAELEEKLKANSSDSDRLAALEKKLAESRIQAARAQVAKETGLPENLITGDNAEEMAEHASSIQEHINKLVEAAVTEKLGANPPMPVVRGEAAGGQPQSDEDWLRKAFLSK